MMKGFILSHETLSYLGLNSFYFHEKEEAYLYLKDVYLAAIISREDFFKRTVSFLRSKGKAVLAGAFEKDKNALENIDHFLIEEAAFWNGSFLKTVESSKRKYDLILLYGDFKMDSIEVRQVLGMIEKVIIQINVETKKELEKVECFTNRIAFAVNR